MLTRYFHSQREKENDFLETKNGFSNKMAQQLTPPIDHKIGVRIILMHFWIKIIGLLIHQT
jgi:hypothetical protein